MPLHHATALAPVHRPSYVVASSGLVHPHHTAIVHPAAVSALAMPTYPHLAHRPAAYLPPRPVLPFTSLPPELPPDLMGGMMTEEEFRRAQKLAQRLA